MPRITLPKTRTDRDQWVDLRDIEDLTQRDRRAVSKVARTEEEEVGYKTTQEMLRILVENWEVFGSNGEDTLPLPATNRDVFDDLPVRVYDALTDAIQPAMELMFSVGKEDEQAADPTPAA